MRAHCSIEIDNCFVVHGVKIIQRPNGRLDVCMPNEKMTDYCPQCSRRNDLQACYCNRCGCELDGERAFNKPSNGGRVHLYQDVAHPISQECRDMITAVVLDAYEWEMKAAEIGGDTDQEVQK